MLIFRLRGPGCGGSQDLKTHVKMPMDPNESVAKAVVDAATTNEASLIITLTFTGTSARLISKYRPRCPILVLCRDAHVGAACNLHRGCVPFHYPRPDEPFDTDTRFAYALGTHRQPSSCGACLSCSRFSTHAPAAGWASFLALNRIGTRVSRICAPSFSLPHGCGTARIGRFGEAVRHDQVGRHGGARTWQQSYGRGHGWIAHALPHGDCRMRFEMSPRASRWIGMSSASGGGQPEESQNIMCMEQRDQNIRSIAVAFAGKAASVRAGH